MDVRIPDDVNESSGSDDESKGWNEIKGQETAEELAKLISNLPMKNKNIETPADAIAQRPSTTRGTTSATAGNESYL